MLEPIPVERYSALAFEDGGRGPRYDCWGLVCLIYEEQLGITLPLLSAAYADSNDTPAIAGLIDRERQRWQRLEQPQRGCVVLFRGARFHVGVMLDNRRMIHMHEFCGVVVEPVASPRWGNRLEGYYRYVG